MAKKSKNDSQLFALIGAVLPIIGFVIAYLVAKNDSYAMFHSKQGLILGIVSIVGSVILGIIPIIGWILLPIFSLVILILWIIGIINSLSGKQKELPIIGSLAKNI